MIEPHLRLSEPRDDENVAALLTQVLGEFPRTDPAVMRWQYWQSPYGPPCGFVWENGSQVLCHYTSLIVPAQIEGARVPAAIGVDAATAPSARGEGLFGRLARTHMDALMERGIFTTFFFPGPSTMLPRWILTRSCHVPLRMFVLPLRGGWLARRFGIPSAAGGALVRTAFRRPGRGGAVEVPDPPEDVDALWNALSPSLSHSIVKDGVWWRWRFGGHPQRPYRYFVERQNGALRAAAVIRVREAHEGRVVHVLELMASEVSAARHVIGAIAGEADADAVALCAPLDSPHARWARAGGLRLVPRRLEREPLSLAAFQLWEDRDPPMGPWAVTWGDMDHL